MRDRFDTVIRIRNLMDDNLHLLRVVRLRMSDGDELVAEIEETTAEIEEIAGRWKSNPPARRRVQL